MAAAGSDPGGSALSDARRRFIETHTIVDAPPLVPEVRLHLSTDVTPLWQATQDVLDGLHMPPPFWAFAWPGGQALARYLLDHPHVVAGKHVLSFASGGGIDAIAARLAGAAVVEANEIDAFGCDAIALNAALNGVSLQIIDHDVMGSLEDRWQIVIAGDICYERPMAEKAAAWFKALVARGVTVLVADPGRNYLPGTGLRKVAEYVVPTLLDLEDRTERTTVLYEWESGA